MYINIKAEVLILMFVFPYYDDDKFNGQFSTHL